MADFPEFSYKQYKLKDDVLYDGDKKTSIEFMKCDKNNIGTDKSTISVFPRTPSNPYDEAVFKQHVSIAVKMAVMLSYNYTNPTRSVDVLSYDYSEQFVDGLYDTVRDSYYLVTLNDYRQLNRLGLINRYVEGLCNSIIVPHNANEHIYIINSMNKSIKETALRLKVNTGYDVRTHNYHATLTNSKLILHEGYKKLELLFLEVKAAKNALVSLPQIDLTHIKTLIISLQNVFALDYDSLEALHKQVQATKTQIEFRDICDGFLRFIKTVSTLPYEDYNEQRDKFIKTYENIESIKNAIDTKRMIAEKLKKADIFKDYAGILEEQSETLQTYIDNGSFNRLYESANCFDKLKVTKKPLFSVFSDEDELNISDNE